MRRPALILAGLGGLLALATLHDATRLAALDTWDELTDMTDLDAALNHRNVQAFLKMLRVGEGTADANGYRRIVGGQLFTDFRDHPRVTVTLTKRDGSPVINPQTGKPLRSSAAGAYQFNIVTWDEFAKKAGVTDFAPPSQDRAAVRLLRELGALADILAGRFEPAVRKAAKRWASLPGSTSGQPQVTLANAMTNYEKHGGSYA